jgi:hypothetical protein
LAEHHVAQAAAADAGGGAQQDEAEYVATSAPVTAKIAMPNQSSAVSQLTCMCVCSARQSKAEIP